nr:uncharacterized protein LOC100609481 isoform X2 [Pan troglodytes]
MESSRWDKDPPGERRPQQSQHWRSWGVGGAGEATRGGLFPVPFPSGDSWPEVTQHRMRFQGQGPWSPGLWTTPAHSHCKPQTGAVDNASPRQPHAPDQHEKNTGRQHLHLWGTSTCPGLGPPSSTHIYRPCPHLHHTIDGVTAWVPVTSRPPPPTWTPYKQSHQRGHDPIRNHLLLHPQHCAQVPGRPQQTVEQPNS